jgi:hypothetical protein
MADNYQKGLLEDIFTAHILILANQIKEQKRAKGINSTSDFIDEAIRLINQKKPRILQAQRF